MMNPEQKMLTTLLELTKDGSVSHSTVTSCTVVPAAAAEHLIKKLVDLTLISINGSLLEASPNQRVRIAIKAVKLGADVENVCRLLKWREFESIATEVFQAYIYKVEKNVRFKEENGKRWEIDLVASKPPILASVDCKQWKRNWSRSSIKKIAEKHVKRTEAFTKTLPALRLNMELGREAIVIPIVLSLLPGSFKFFQDTPIVPILQLQSFLNGLSAHAHLLTHFCNKHVVVDKKLTEY